VRGARAVTVVATLIGGLVLVPAASAAFVDLGVPVGPLTHIYVGDALGCQAFHTGDTRGEFFGSQTDVGSCGTSVAVADPTTGAITVYGFRSTALTPVSQSPVAGRGTRPDPRRVTTVADAGTTGVRVTQIDSYVSGDEAYRTDVSVTSGTGGAVVVYHAGDCYLQNSDVGYGFHDSATGGIYCTQTPNNRPAGRLLGFRPLTAGSSFEEGNYSTVFADVNKGTPLPNKCDCTIREDNGAGLSWSGTLAAGAPQTFSLENVFSPTGSTTGGPVTGLPSPRAGRTTNAVPVAGRVLVRLPGSRRFEDLRQARQLPIGTIVDASRGSMSLTTARDLLGHTQTGAFSNGAFLIRQKLARRPITDLVLRGGSFRTCRPGAASVSSKRGAHSARRRSHRPVRRLWGRGKGNFRTVGRYSAAAVRGTYWLTTDRCDGTLTKVREGVVRVRDFTLGRTVRVRAGHSYLARAR